ncbi:hypothetical protein OIU74_026240 [Salix koriyanagi]|uniref:Uncharacterized protein n=1 Tax=Salix koriyanagi TaxID=2511006 RepID=A0A9Q0W0Q4_9ROSI|nr:hypothetical protein OIU74_026240 [Salix koriyanagi]
MSWPRLSRLVPKRSRRSSPSLHRRSDCLIKNTYGCPSKGGLITRMNKSYNWAQMGFLCDCFLLYVTLLLRELIIGG